MKKIKLTQGKYALVDDQDFDWLNQFKWCFSGDYAVREKLGKRIYMHRVTNKTPEGLETDHINRNKLDNQRINLRTATRSENNHNTEAKGFTFDKINNKWRARIYVDYKEIHLGRFGTKEEALLAYQVAKGNYYD